MHRNKIFLITLSCMLVIAIFAGLYIGGVFSQNKPKSASDYESDSKNKNNLLINGYFKDIEKTKSEDLPNGWTKTIKPSDWNITNNFNSKNYTAEYDKTVSKNKGSGSLKVGGDDNNMVRIIVSQTVTGLNPEKRYILSGWIKMDNYSMGNKGSLATGPILQAVSLKASKVFQTEPLLKENEYKTSDWEYVNIAFVPESDELRIDCHYNTGTGYVWFDHIELKETLEFSKINETIVTDDAHIDTFQWGKINGRSFQQDAIATYNGWQYASFYNTDRYVCLARRKLPDGEWSTIVFDDYKQQYDDGHASLSIGICPGDGSIHIAFDCMGTETNLDPYLHYRKSTIPGYADNPEEHVWSTENFTPVLNHLTGSPLTVSYPRFIITPQNKLQFEYRSAAIIKGKSYLRELFLHEYDGITGEWIFLGKYATNREDDGPSMYIHGLDYDSDGRLHISWTWCDMYNIPNRDLNYTYSDDLGRSWYNTRGDHIATTGSDYICGESQGVTVFDIPSDYKISNQNGQAVDSKGRIHVITNLVDIDDPSITDPANETKKFTYHFWRDTNGTWHKTKICEADKRSKIVLDKNDNAYALVSSLIVMCATADSNYTDWHVLYDADADRFTEEVCYDRNRLKYGDGVLSVLFLERNSNNFVCLDFKFDEL